jgi:hypothetical protein
LLVEVLVIPCSPPAPGIDAIAPPNADPASIISRVLPSVKVRVNPPSSLSLPPSSIISNEVDHLIPESVV